MDRLPPALLQEPSAHIRSRLDQSLGLEVGQGGCILHSFIPHCCYYCLSCTLIPSLNQVSFSLSAIIQVSEQKKIENSIAVSGSTATLENF